MTTCPSCGKELPAEDLPFCPFCTAPLAERPGAPVHEERKVVAVLFCDLVGFTASSDAADPEDVRARIRPYHQRLRQELERYGGTVEKFVGDAVMAVFGAPLAHEDDAERAVRAGLRILDAIGELNAAQPNLELRVRIGIQSGEAMVDRDARPDRGEGIVTGDVVNTAARLQSVAPVGGIAVGEATYRLTKRAFEYEQLESAQVKGKAEALEIWRPLAARARFGTGLSAEHATPLIGREPELTRLRHAYVTAVAERTPRLVTVVGEPGIGKSRLVSELGEFIDSQPELVRWRQGRCLPYGERNAFWALGEIVKAEAGIWESDSPEEAVAKLEATLPRDDPDRPWLRARSAPLVGARGEPVSQEESFTAWRRLLELWASSRKTVLVFEDLQWANDALLGFLEYLADSPAGSAMFLLCTTRPELYEHHPQFGAKVRNAERIDLGPLSDEATSRLISALLERETLPADTQGALLEPTAGNPLYAEEFVRLLADRGLTSDQVGDVPFPESVQALIASRLDLLPVERKTVLQDASVVGKVFWAGAIFEMGVRDESHVDVSLDDLSRRELVLAASPSSMEGEAEYRFKHALVRDVCHAQIPRADRAARHRLAAAWIERKAAGRTEDVADVLAHHYVHALELGRAAGPDRDVERLEASARRYLALAGEQALALDVASAEASLARALELAPAGHQERPGLLERWAEAAIQQGRLQEARSALEEALDAYRAADESVPAGRTLTALALVLGRLGDPHREDAITEALALLQTQPPGPEHVAAYAQLAGRRELDHAFPEAIAAAERALALAAELGLAEPARALGFLGSSRAALGELEGIDDMRRALDLSIEQGKGREAAVLYNNLSVDTWLHEGPRAALATSREGIDFCKRRGITEFAFAITGVGLTLLTECGLSEQALDEAGPVVEWAGKAGMLPDLIEARSVQVRLLVERGEGQNDRAVAGNLAAMARETTPCR